MRAPPSRPLLRNVLSSLYRGEEKEGNKGGQRGLSGNEKADAGGGADAVRGRMSEGSGVLGKPSRLRMTSFE
ncbi:MAG: hypothetical protein D6679_10110 [Candidatus Hydrogenedentota bacterium]|nr:MAG: hypothetical protein D6679_10110 [Candidatus Hydrogenedentota bacterium]